ncbi:MAG: hypothetical protein IVW51_00270 [Thermaceae bacterium]|nr:hypothetical protein [Thermaceae bacterium]
MNSKGLTLIEVLVALIFVAIGGITLGYLLSSFSATRQAQGNTSIQAVGRSYLDSLKADWTLKDNYVANQVPDKTQYGGGVFGVSEPVITTSSNAAITPNSPDASGSIPCLKNISITVSRSSGAPQQQQFSSQIAAPTGTNGVVVCVP